MAEKIIINPVTRINGFLEIEADVENSAVQEVKTKGLMFRGFEKMLEGRSPFDAVYFTERICGICSTAHSVASALALEDALGVVPTEQGRYLRDLVHACEFFQNHFRHFYQFTLPDFVRLPEEYPLFSINHEDYRLPGELNDKMVQDYFESLEFSRNAHEMLAVLGGKAPHNHGIFIGGITSVATADKIIAIKSILESILRFIEEKMIPDVYTIGDYYPEYYHMGGGYGNLLSYGCFNDYKDLGTLYVDALTFRNGTVSQFSADRISQETEFSWFNRENEPDIQKAEAYSWIKAPRYDGIPYEVGPLARQWLSGEYRNGISAMDRTIARVLETKKLAEVMNILLDNLIPGQSLQTEYSLPETASGMGLVDTTRGALGHWIYIEDSKIAFYQVITPSAWNLSPQAAGQRGTSEQALLSTPVADAKVPVEIGRIIRSFDPCVSCATHVFTGGQEAGCVHIL